MVHCKKSGKWKKSWTTFAKKTFIQIQEFYLVKYQMAERQENNLHWMP